MKKAKPPVKLDISVGPFIPENFTRFSKYTSYPWPFKNDSVEEIYSAFLLCRVPGKDRGKFMDEVYRILIPGGKITIISPYWSSARAIQDYTHEWPPIVEQSFDVFNKDFRDINKLTDPPYPQIANFTATGGYTFDPETATRSDETRPFWVKHYLNSVADLQMVLTKK
jgi:Methyltransferase domain